MKNNNASVADDAAYKANIESLSHTISIKGNSNAEILSYSTINFFVGERKSPPPAATRPIRSKQAKNAI
jgi:hypothetical protein